ncbi:hypothetical protein CO154_00155 [Candidatus Pacearchaeota archaeon CG_4_9_14_3_um_filter_31_7]|nr:MAG: hypothetical protein AUJ10_00295 [Candidatus Pacearchaeota archaeon CG1_02_31_27]PIN92253.1 MAG: hypothetical protein COU55_02010 [Candidatus Pacearchaeota archaeon CG10_big_fil_rev_8_21_14_0_10_31_59]PIZ81227.1 MAG: hypothetical protein COX99_00145 [Candidatus Pacearchaeota archaeon CG_4_10_14_0_2_um_filter_31_10]PJA70948.1 MAG: hypothetical protein CO154_00155 [Candidatus Pacearchaeota archaeon CG_4_9_14_3_um_filter_31_7]
MISFQEIYNLFIKEKYSEQLYPISKNFFKEVAEYIKDKEGIAEKKSDVFDDTIQKTKKQLESIQSILKELMMLREKKILQLASIAARTGVSKKDVENMFDFEKELFENVNKNIEDTHKKFSQKLNGEEKKDLKKNILIRFIKDTPKLLDLSGEEIGPFKKGDMANLSEEISNILIKDSKAMLVEIN